MSEGQFSSPPESYLKIITPLIDTARGFLERGEQLASVAFVVSFTTGKTIPVLLDSSSDASKDQGAKALRMATEVLEADFVFVIMEAWSLREDKVAQMEAIIEKHGSIGASPYRVDTATFALETRHGVWVTQCGIKPKGISKKKRTIGKPEFRFFTEVEGRFSHLLGPVDDAGGGVLH